jgi:hypothetical protein
MSLSATQKSATRAVRAALDKEGPVTCYGLEAPLALHKGQGASSGDRRSAVSRETAKLAEAAFERLPLRRFSTGAMPLASSLRLCHRHAAVDGGHERRFFGPGRNDVAS